MTQLSNDCFAFGGKLMTVEESVALIAERVAPVAGAEIVGLSEADGRILAQSITAPIAIPPFDNSAVDGYAVRFADLRPEAETLLAVQGRVAAGAAAGAAPAGVAVRIFTGAPMPAGADTVFMQEDVRLDGERVALPAGLRRGANCRPAGEDVAKGDCVLAAGRRLRPQDIGLIAALGIDKVSVRRPVRVAVLSTGDEIVPPGGPLPPASIYDSNRFVIMALLRRLGAEVTDYGIVTDERELVADALARAADHDLIVSSGGVSTGEEDHVKAAVESTGALAFWRLAIKPGRPVAMGVVRGTPFVGLPGNPVAVFVTFAHVVRPLLTRLGGGEIEPIRPVPVRAGFRYKKKEGRREYVRVSLVRAADGGVEAQKHPRDGAGVITSLTETDGLAELAEPVTQVQPGDAVGFYPYAVLR